MTPNQKLGHKWEMWAAQQCAAHGYNVSYYTSLNSPADFKANGVPVEVKFARQTVRKIHHGNKSVLYPRWQWQVENKAAQLRDDWVLILLACDGPEVYPFILPGQLIARRNHLQLTSKPVNYTGWLSQWLNRWEIIGYLEKRIYQRGGPIFQQWLEAAA